MDQRVLTNVQRGEMKTEGLHSQQGTFHREQPRVAASVLLQALCDLVATSPPLGDVALVSLEAPSNRPGPEPTPSRLADAAAIQIPTDDRVGARRPM